MELPNFSIEHIVMPPLVPGLPDRELIIVTPTFAPMTPEGIEIQQRITEEIALHGVIYGVPKGP